MTYLSAIQAKATANTAGTSASPAPIRSAQAARQGIYGQGVMGGVASQSRAATARTRPSAVSRAVRFSIGSLLGHCLTSLEGRTPSYGAQVYARSVVGRRGTVAHGAPL